MRIAHVVACIVTLIRYICSPSRSSTFLKQIQRIYELTACLRNIAHFIEFDASIFLYFVCDLFSNHFVKQGAATTIYCALAKDVVSGGYYDSCALSSPNALGQDMAKAQRLEEISLAVLRDKGFVVPAHNG